MTHRADPPAVIVSLCGTEPDPQDLAGERAALAHLEACAIATSVKWDAIAARTRPPSVT